VSPLLLRAQSVGDPAVAPGSPSQAYALTGIDHVNYYNGLNNIVVPIYTVGGRGSASFSVPVAIQRLWLVNGGLSTYPSSNVGVVLPDFFGVGTENPDHVFAEPVTTNGCTATYLVYAAANGTRTYLRDLVYNGQPSCGTAYDRGRIFQSSDGSNLTIITSADVVDGQSNQITNAVLIGRDGTRRTIGIPGANLTSTFTGIEDRNGNMVGITGQADGGNSELFTAQDGFGNSVLLTNEHLCCIDPGGPFGVVELAYPGAAGGGYVMAVRFNTLSRALAQGESNQTLHDLFPELVGSSYSYFTPLVVSSITLADQTSTYSFSYNSYGEVVSLKLPTGATYTYTYQEAYKDTGYGIGDGVVTLPSGQYFLARRLLERDGPSEKTLFSATGSSSGLDPNHPSRPGTLSTVTFEDASSNVLRVEKHYFYGNALAPSVDSANTSGFADWWLGLEFRTDILDGAGKLWQSTQRVYGQRPCAPGENCWFDPQSESVQPHDPQMCLTTTKNDAGQISGTGFQYDQYSNITDKYDFDYGSAPTIGASCPTSFSGAIRHTHTSFVTGSYVPPGTNILCLPSSVAVLDSGGNQYSLTNYFYDQQVPSPAPDIVQHDSNYGTGFNVRGNPTSVQRWRSTDPDSPATTALEYDIAGNVLTSIDANNNKTTFVYNDDGANEYAFSTSATNALGQKTSATYDYGVAKLSTSTDLNGNVTSFTYNDYFNRLTNVQFPSGQTMSYNYSNASGPSVLTKRDKDTAGDQALGTQIIYDGLGRPIESATLESACSSCYAGNLYSTQHIASKTNYDALGRVSQTFNPSRQNPADGLGYATTYQHDPLGRTKSIQSPDGSASSVVYSGNVATTTDQNGNSNQYTTDGLGRLTKVVEDTSTSQYSTTYTYDILNRLTMVTEGSEIRSFSYDSLGNLISAKNPESGTVTYSYDVAGNPLTRTDNRQITATYSNYDKLNRPGTVSYSDQTPAVNFSYDATGVTNSKGHVTSVSSAGVSTTGYGPFNAMGQVLASTQTTAGHAYPFSYSYNLAGQLTSETFPSGRVVTTGYDGASRPNSATGTRSGTSTNYVSNMNYWPHGAPNYFTYDNKLWRVAAYNARLQPIRTYDALDNNQNDAAHMLFVTCPLWGAPNGSGGGSGYAQCPSTSDTNDNGNLLGLTIFHGSSVFTQTFGYDRLNRLTSAGEKLGATQTWSQTYNYDQFGNIWMPPSTGLPAYGAMPSSNIYNAKNQDPNLAYDQAGNQTALGALMLSYDANNRQTVATNTLGGGTATYQYDGLGQRVAKALPAQTTVYVYDAFGQLSAQYNSQAPTAPACLTCYLSYDHLGTVRMVTDSAGNVIARHDFAPFGQEIPSGYAGRGSLWGSTIDVDPKFTGQLRDTETTEDFFNARYYHGQQTRFLSPDPANAGAHPADPQTWNAYAYVRGNPLGATDPSGTGSVTTLNQCQANLDLCKSDNISLWGYDQYLSYGTVTGRPDPFTGFGNLNGEEIPNPYNDWSPTVTIGLSKANNGGSTATSAPTAPPTPAPPTTAQPKPSAPAPPAETPIEMDFLTGQQKLWSGTLDIGNGLGAAAGAIIAAPVAFDIASVAIFGGAPGLLAGETPVIGGLSFTTQYLGVQGYSVLSLAPALYNWGTNVAWLKSAVATSQSFVVGAGGIITAAEENYLASQGYTKIGSFLVPPLK
jgi:RHS repeat-associated protein